MTHHLTGQTGWMVISTQMESGLCCAVKRKIKEGCVTLCRFSSDLKQVQFTEGYMKSPDDDPLLWRTQAEIVLKIPVQKRLKQCVGNHQIVIYGNHIQPIQEFCSQFFIECINE